VNKKAEAVYKLFKKLADKKKPKEKKPKDEKFKKYEGTDQD
jgi:hypothetical protein